MDVFLKELFVKYIKTFTQSFSIVLAQLLKVKMQKDFRVKTHGTYLEICPSPFWKHLKFHNHSPAKNHKDHLEMLHNLVCPQ